MPDIEDDGFTEEAFKGLGDDPAPVTPPSGDPQTPPATPPAAAAEPPKDDPKGDPKPPEEPKKDEQPAKPKEDEKTPPAPATDEKKPEETPKPPETPEAPAPPAEEPKPLTKDDVQEVVSNLLNSERMSGKELEAASQEVLEKYYPDGLSNVLVDERTGKELRTPQDVVEVTNGEMTTDQAAQWLMNEQFKLDQQVDNIKSQAKEIAQTTVNFKRDSLAMLQKYEPLFKAYPFLQKKSFDLMMKQVKVDKERDVILSAPDVTDLYDTYLEPYQLAYEHSTQQSATNPTPSTTPEPPKPTAEDRMDEGGDGGATAPNDPNDFAQQVVKELAKPL